MGKKWYKWPQGYYNKEYPYKEYLPWYTILRRLSISPLLFVGFLLSYVAVVIGFGYEEAERFRGNFR